MRPGCGGALPGVVLRLLHNLSFDAGLRQQMIQAGLVRQVSIIPCQPSHWLKFNPTTCAGSLSPQTQAGLWVVVFYFCYWCLVVPT